MNGTVDNPSLWHARLIQRKQHNTGFKSLVVASLYNAVRVMNVLGVFQNEYILYYYLKLYNGYRCNFMSKMSKT